MIVNPFRDQLVAGNMAFDVTEWGHQIARVAYAKEEYAIEHSLADVKERYPLLYQLHLDTNWMQGILSVNWFWNAEMFPEDYEDNLIQANALAERNELTGEYYNVVRDKHEIRYNEWEKNNEQS